MLTEILNINNIIITKSLEFFSTIGDCNIIAQLEMLYEIKEEYLKLVESVRDTPYKNHIADLFNKFEDNNNSTKIDEYQTYIYDHTFGVMGNEVIDLITEIKNSNVENIEMDERYNMETIFNKFEDNSYTICNIYDSSTIIDENESFFIYRQNEESLDKGVEEILYKVVNIKKYEDGTENYTVELYKGKLIDTVIDDECNLHSVIKFKDELIGLETRPSWWYIDDKYSSSLETQLKAYKYKHFDFNIPLKILTPQDNEEC